MGSFPVLRASITLSGATDARLPFPAARGVPFSNAATTGATGTHAE